jgi:hypothetical protein
MFHLEIAEIAGRDVFADIVGSVIKQSPGSLRVIPFRPCRRYWRRTTLVPAGDVMISHLVGPHSGLDLT